MWNPRYYIRWKNYCILANQFGFTDFRKVMKEYKLRLKWKKDIKQWKKELGEHLIVKQRN